ncbi:MAG TPA: glycosyltransferase family 4 protein [Thermoleophilaceae bacterium]
MPRCLLVFEPPDGGVAENVMRLAVGMREHGWEPFVAGPMEALFDPQLAAAGVPRARLPLERGYGHPARDARALRRLAGIMARGRFDLVHAHSAKAGVLGRIAARLTGTPCVYSPHCFPFVGPWGLARRAFSTGVERALGPATDAILCVADQERGLALEKGLARPERLAVVHNGSRPCETGLDPDPALESMRAAGPLAATMAVLRPQKAVHVFLEAAPLVLERVPDAQLAVVGDGDLREELERRAGELGVADRVRFLRFLPPASRQLASVDVFVLPSAWEAFPISVLEAMACGVPTVATDVGGTAEALDDGVTGLLCPPGDPPALADRVARLLGDPSLRERMGEAARARHASLFTLERMVAETVALYDAVHARGG